MSWREELATSEDSRQQEMLVEAAQSRGGWRLTKMSTARVYIGNHRTRSTGPSPGLPGGTGTWQVWAARQQPLCSSEFGKSSSRLNGGKEWLPLVNHKVGLQNGRYKGRANASNSPDLLLTLKGRSAQPPKGSMPPWVLGGTSTGN